MTRFDKKKLLIYLEQAERSGEHKYLTELFSELEDHPEFSEFLKNEWDKYFDSEDKTNKDLSGLLNKLHKEIELIESRKKSSFTKRFISTYSKIAAIFLLPLLATSIFFYYQSTHTQFSSGVTAMAEIHAPENSRVKYTLPDSSVVWLNSGASIKYSALFATNRHVELTGKAYFEVTHDKVNPFTVSFVNGKVEVLGTKFSVASKDNGDFNVTLVEGKVRALVGIDNKPVVLSPDQMLAVNGSHYVIKEVNAGNVVAWINGKLIFRDTPFAEVVKRLSDWYDVDINIKDNSLKQITYRGVFKDESLDGVLNLLSITLPVKYKKLPRVKRPDGKFEKEKIFIYRNN